MKITKESNERFKRIIEDILKRYEMSVDSKIIIILGLCAVLAIALDDRVGERWCQTYDWCSEDIGRWREK